MIQVEWIGNGVRLVAGFHVVRVEFVGILVEQWAVQRGGTVHGDVPVAVVHGDEHGAVRLGDRLLRHPLWMIP